MKVFKWCDCQLSEWAGGVTRQLFIVPEGSTLAARDFDLRISSAVISAVESRFSDFSGYKRVILPLQGEMKLLVGGRTVVLSAASPYYFDGSEEVRSVNSSGAMDFNVIYRPELEVDVRMLVGGDYVGAESDTILFALQDMYVGMVHVSRYSCVHLDEGARVSGRSIAVQYKCVHGKKGASPSSCGGKIC